MKFIPEIRVPDFLALANSQIVTGHIKRLRATYGTRAAGCQLLLYFILGTWYVSK
jgi:hypothetical protein